jgi:hypothetical protein
LFDHHLRDPIADRERWPGKFGQTDKWKNLPESGESAAYQE